MSGRKNGCILSIMTMAGVPILTIPDGDKANVFAMLVYSLVTFASTMQTKEDILCYTIKKRKLYMRLAKKTFIALYVPEYMDAKAKKFLELSSDLLEKLDSMIVEEGVIDDRIILRAKEEMRRVAISSGIPISSAPTFRKICGDLYGELLERGLNSEKFKGYFRVGYFPKLVDNELAVRENNPILKRILKLCDGNYSVAYICDTLGIPEAKLYRFIAKLLRSGRMILEVGFELVE